MEISVFEIYLNGAFFTDLALDTDRLIADGYAEHQERLSARLGGEDNGWNYMTVSTKPWFSSKELYPTLVPLGFITHGGEELRSALVEALNSIPISLELRFHVGQVGIDFFAFGVGVASARIAVQFDESQDLASVRRKVSTLVDAIATAFNTVIEVECRSLGETCEEVLNGYLSDVPWCQDDGLPGLAERRISTVGLTPPHRLLWLHRTYLFEVASAGEVDTASETIEVLFPSIHEAIPYPNFSFFPGISTSVVLSCPEESGGDHIVKIADVISIMNLQWAILAAGIEADRTLFRRLNLFAAQSVELRPRRLELESLSVLALYGQIRLFQGYIDSVLIDWGRPMHNAWRGMARVQGLDSLLASIGDKLHSLQQACQVQLARASAKRQNRLGLTVDMFAVFGVVAGASGTAAFLFSTDVEGGLGWRATVAALVFVLVMVVILIREILDRRAP